MKQNENVFKTLHRIFLAYGFVVKMRSSVKIEYELGDLDILLHNNSNNKTCSLWMGSKYLHQIDRGQ